MFIEDDELRTLYRDASAEHLEKLEAGFLTLEHNPEDRSPIQDLMRAAHSLKGDSRMLGVNDAETVTHKLEDLLTGIEQGTQPVTPELCDGLYIGLDAIRKIVHEALTGESAGKSTFQAIAHLMALENSVSAEMPSTDTVIPHPFGDMNRDAGVFPSLEQFQGQTLHSQEVAVQSQMTIEELEAKFAALDLGSVDDTASEPALEQKTQSEHKLEEGEYQIDTVRVEASKLDSLMTQAGELSVTQLRISRRVEDVAKIYTLWESWSREVQGNREAMTYLLDQVKDERSKALQRMIQASLTASHELGTLVRQLRLTSYEDTARLETVSSQLESDILKLRTLPLSSMFSLFPRMVRDLAKQQGKDIQFIIEGGDTFADKRILEEMKDPLTHILRNAVDHGIETPEMRIAAGKPAKATLRLRAYRHSSRIGIEVIDDGQGLDSASIKRTALRRQLYTQAELDMMPETEIQSLIFEPGFSTRSQVTAISGRGVGLDVVRANVTRLKGSIQVDSSLGQGCTFRFSLSTSLATTYALIVAVNQSPFAIPVDSVDRMIRVSREEFFSIEGNPTITVQEQPISVVWLSDLLQLPVPSPETTRAIATDTTASIPCVIMKVGTDRIGLLVDTLLEQQDIILKPHSKLLKYVRNIAGATILDNGDVCMVLNPQDLVNTARDGASSQPLDSDSRKIQTAPKVLLVEDSLPIRTQVRRILEGAGYEVTVAVDGLEGFQKLPTDTFSAIVSDVEMPNLTGLELTKQIRQDHQYDELPIILVTTLASDADKRRGTDAGANAYITKGDFDQNLLLTTLRSLI